jgi:cobalt-zinc-cadmium efflux system membrane fusion protein
MFNSFGRIDTMSRSLLCSFACLSMFAAMMATGCSKSAEAPAAGQPAAPDNAPTAAVESSPDSGHSGWWCAEHGVPEEVCGLCDAKLAAQFQRDGDWCKEHDRPDSQCFICHPELEATFAARYEAKYGKAPPKPQG